MDYHYGYQQRRSRSQPRLAQQPSPAYLTSERDYPISGTNGAGHFNSSVNASHWGTENRPWRSQSLENRKDWVVSDDYGFPTATRAEDRHGGGTIRYQQQHQHQPRNYDYQPYLNVNTVPSASYRGTYEGRHGVTGSDPYFDSSAAPRYHPAENEWDALDRSIRNYREDPGTAQTAATMRRTKAQSLSPTRPSGFLNSTSTGVKPRQYNFSSFFHRFSGNGSGSVVEPQSGISMNKNVSTQRYRNDYPGGPTAQEEVEFGAEHGTINYYRGGGSAQQQQDIYMPSGPTTARGWTTIRGTTGRYGPETQKYYKLHCCCFSFRWPPWAVEEVEPPQPMYRRHT